MSFLIRCKTSCVHVGPALGPLHRMVHAISIFRIEVSRLSGFSSTRRFKYGRPLRGGGELGIVFDGERQ
jgi:hypothetical protein